MVMSHFSDMLMEHLGANGLKPYAIAKVIEERELKPHPQTFYSLCRGSKEPTETILRQLSEIPELKLSYDTLVVWKAVDDYTPEQLADALKQKRALQRQEKAS